MDLYIDNLLNLDQDLVDQIQQELAQKLQEAFPEVDLGRGVLHDVVLHLMSILSAALETRIDLVRQSQSLLMIGQNPALADEDLVDAVLSNYRITRQSGQAASGRVTIVIDALVPVTIPAGALFTAGSAAFAPTQAYAARTSPALVASASDRVLRPLGDGTYAFTIPMTALDVGSQGALRRATRLAPAIKPPHFVAAYAEGDFSGGWNAESNADLLNRLQEGIAVKAWSNRASIDALLRDQPAFARLLNTSIIGFGDPEMLRDQHTLFPISLGGRCDLYARTAALPLSTTLQLTCTLVARTAQGGLWQFSLGRDDAPGFYLIDRVAPLNAAPADSGYMITSDQRGYDLTGLDWTPDIEQPIEAVYSAFQTGTFQFLDTTAADSTLVENVSQQTYAVSVSHMPQIDELQAFLGARSVRSPGGDVLVKAPIPCFLSIGLIIHKRAVLPAPALDSLCDAVVNLVNTTGFVGYLHASEVSGVVRDLLPSGMAVSLVDLFGRIRAPDGSWRPLRSSEVLTIPNDPELMISGRTVVFILAPDDVAITVVDVEMDNA